MIASVLYTLNSVIFLFTVAHLIWNFMLEFAYSLMPLSMC